MTLEKLDEALALLPATPTTDSDLDRRAALMAQRITLDQATRAAAANSRPQPRGGLIVNVPPGVGTSHYYSNRARVAQSRVTEDGRVVLDLFPQEFRTLLSDRRFGQLWHDENPEALSQLAGV
jgi:hypothetical protein